jgi:hypothetical protein
MFVAQLAAWMTTPINSAATATDHPAHPNLTLFSRANHDPGACLDDDWEVSIPRQEWPGQPPMAGPGAQTPTDGIIRD